MTSETEIDKFNEDELLGVDESRKKGRSKKQKQAAFSFDPVDKASMGFELHQFKLNEQVAKQKTSGSLKELKIQKVKHRHVFKTHNKLGVKQSYTNLVAGHFHEVKWQQEPNGKIKIISIGEPLMYVTEKVKTRLGSKTKQKIVPVRFEGEMQRDGIEGEEIENVTIVDAHTHTIESYTGRQLVTKEIQTKIRNDNKSAFRDVEINNALNTANQTKQVETEVDEEIETSDE